MHHGTGHHTGHVWARTLFIMGDLDLHPQGHDLDLQGNYTPIGHMLWHYSFWGQWCGQEPFLLWATLNIIFKVMTLTFKVITPC